MRREWEERCEEEWHAGCPLLVCVSLSVAAAAAAKEVASSEWGNEKEGERERVGGERQGLGSQSFRFRELPGESA